MSELNRSVTKAGPTRRQKSECPYSGPCSGCSYWGIPFDAQLRRKADFFRQIWDHHDLGSLPEIQMIAPADRGLRDRLDFQWHSAKDQTSFGIYERSRKTVLDLKECYQLSPALHDWLVDFRRLRWPVGRASFRLRVAPDGKRGAWMDLSNLDAKALLEDQSVLEELLDLATVEMGQRRKRLYKDEKGKLRLLKDPQFYPWTRTWMGGTSVALMSRIADFSQPGDLINQILVSQVAAHLQNCEAAIDWGCGSGNFSFPLLEKANHVYAFDSDAMSLLGLKSSIAGSNAGDRITAAQVNFYDRDLEKGSLASRALNSATAWIVDPPRSGVGSLFETIPRNVNQIISVSCFAESFMVDAAKLFEHGFHCDSLTMVDQFPQTPHAEWVSNWTR